MAHFIPEMTAEAHVHKWHTAYMLLFVKNTSCFQISIVHVAVYERKLDLIADIELINIIWLM